MDVKHFSYNVAALALLMGAVACNNVDDALSEKERDFSNNFTEQFGSIDPEQDWNLFATRPFSFGVGGSGDEEYDIAVCDSNPALATQAHRLLETKARGNSTVSLTVNCDKNLTVLYVLRTDSKGVQVTTPAYLQDGTFEGFFYADGVLQTNRSRGIKMDNDPFTFYDTQDYYKTAIPSGASEACYGTQWNDENALQSVSAFALKNDNKEYKYHFWTGQRDFYVSGKNVTFTSDGGSYVNQARIYVLPGASLNFNMSSAINDLEIYVCEGAVVNYNANELKKQTGGGRIFNHGTLNFKQSINVGTDAVVYNEGDMTFEQGLNMTPGDAHPGFVYNYGTLDVKGDLTTSAKSSNIYNEGQFHISGNQRITQAECWLVNAGHYTIDKDFLFSASNSSVYDYCSLVVKGTTIWADGSMTMMPQSFMKTANLKVKNLQAAMKANSTFVVENQAEFYVMQQSLKQGFAAEGENALVLLKGNTYLKTEELFCQWGNTWTSGASSKALLAHQLSFLGTAKYSIENLVKESPAWGLSNHADAFYAESGTQAVEMSSIQLKEPTDEDCGASHDQDPGGQDTEDPVYTIAFEDLGTTDDFDFNDIVLFVTTHKDNTATVQLVGNGGSLETGVYYKNQHLFTAEGNMHTTYEVMAAADVQLSDGWTPQGLLHNFSIKVRGNDSGTIYSHTDKGRAPQALLIPGKWAWPTERTNIREAYPRFVDWAQNKDANTDWYTNASGPVVVIP